MTFIDSSIIALSILALFIVIDGLVGTSLDCWKASAQTTAPEPQAEASVTEPTENIKEKIQKALEHVYIAIEEPATPVTLPEDVFSLLEDEPPVYHFKKSEINIPTAKKKRTSKKKQ